LDADKKTIAWRYAPVFDTAGVRLIGKLLSFKMLSTGGWHGGLSDEAVEDTVNPNLHVMRFHEVKERTFKLLPNSVVS